MVPEVVGLSLDEPHGVDERDVADVGLLRGQQLGEDHDLGAGEVQDGGGMELHLKEETRMRRHT